jgi:hypothetical protein
MRWFAHSGKRPFGWWAYESPFRSRRHPGIAHQKSILWEFSDALGADERAELEAFWRCEFEKSWAPNFSFYADGKIYSGDDARWQHWLFCDLPPELLNRWLKEREQLEQESSSERAGVG